MSKHLLKSFLVSYGSHSVQNITKGFIKEKKKTYTYTHIHTHTHTEGAQTSVAGINLGKDGD